MKKKSEGISWSVILVSAIVGGLAGHYLIEPGYRKFLDKRHNLTQEPDAEKLKEIEQKITNYSHLLFEDYFGSEAEEKYQEYYNQNNRSNQLNPNNDAYWQSRGHNERPDDWEEKTQDGNEEYSQSELDNHANQMNPNNDAYWQSRGEDERPDDWEERSKK